MSPRMRFTSILARSWPTALTCLMLAGCGASNAVVSKVTGLISQTPPAPPIVVSEGAPTMKVRLPMRGVSGGMARIALRGDVSEWRSSDGISLTLKDGQIIATRGFGADLAIADVRAAMAAMRQGAGDYNRTMHWLDGESHDQVEVFACTLRAAQDQTVANLRVLSESCTGAQRSFTNTYTVLATTGAVIHSDQWVSPGLGHIEIDPR